MLTVNDTAPALLGTVNAVLTGATADFHIRRPDATTMIRSATVTDPINGKVSMDWVTGDLVSAGVYKVELQVTFSNGEIQTFYGATFTVRNEYA